MGYNWFDYFGCGEYYARWEHYPLKTPLYPDLDDEAGWEAVEAGLDGLEAGWIRFGMPPNPHVGSEGEPVTETVHVGRLKRVCKWAASRGKPVLLDFFTTPARYEYPLPEGVKTPHHWLINMAPKDNRRYAREFVAPLLKELVDTMGLEAIRFFNPVNEPMEYGVFQTPGDGPPAIEHYAGLYRELREALDGVGLTRDRLGLVGLDTIEPLRRLFSMHAHGVDIDPYVDAYSVHHYNLRFDHSPPKAMPDTTPGYFDVGIAGVIEREDAEVLRYCRERGKPLWALEMGSFYEGKFFNPAGVSQFDTVLAVSEAILRAANLGISTFCIWSLMNTNDVDGHWAVMEVGKGNWHPCEPAFSLYRMLGQHFRPGAEVFPLDPDPETRPRYLYGSRAAGPSGGWSLLLVNDHPDSAFDVVVEGEEAARWEVFTLVEEGSAEAKPLEGGPELGLRLPPQSMTLVRRLLR